MKSVVFMAWLDTAGSVWPLAPARRGTGGTMDANMGETKAL